MAARGTNATATCHRSRGHAFPDGLTPAEKRSASQRLQIAFHAQLATGIEVTTSGRLPAQLTDLGLQIADDRT